MTKNEKLLAALVAFMIIVNLTLASVLISRSEENDIEEALKSCLLDVENNCKGVIGYAVALERENSRLNTALKKRCTD